METQFGLSERALDDIRALAKQYGIERVILFGSRARGDYRRTSDIDLAIEGGDTIRFTLDVEEKVWTLLTFDVVDLGRPVERALKDSIQEEGIVLYEKV